MIFVPVVNSSHTTGDMLGAAFGTIDRRASATLETPRRFPQVVQRPSGDAACIVALGLAVAADSSDAVDSPYTGRRHRAPNSSDVIEINLCCRPGNRYPNRA